MKTESAENKCLSTKDVIEYMKTHTVEELASKDEELITHVHTLCERISDIITEVPEHMACADIGFVACLTMHDQPIVQMTLGAAYSVNNAVNSIFEETKEVRNDPAARKSFQDHIINGRNQSTVINQQKDEENNSD